MISLEGLTLLTGRHGEARSILHTFARHVRDGLIPNLFPEGRDGGPLSHGGRDAVVLPRPRSLRAGDGRARDAAVPAAEAVRHRGAPPRRHALRHRRRSRGRPAPPGRGRLPAHLDGRQGRRLGGDAAPGQGGRDQRALLQRAHVAGALARADTSPATSAAPASTCARRSCGRTPTACARRSTGASGTTATGCLFDVVDGEGAARDDASIRPNQLLAISLPHPVLDPARWPDVMSVVRERLATPFGLRSLAPGHPDYKPRYDGDLRARDAAYHQGTVWGWLIGPFVDAWLKTFPSDRAGARRLLDGLEQQLVRRLHRHDQRDLRRRAALPRPRLRRPGLERRRSPPRPRRHRLTVQRSDVCGPATPQPFALAPAKRGEGKGEGPAFTCGSRQ